MNIRRLMRTSDAATVLAAIRTAVAPQLPPASDPWSWTAATMQVQTITTAWNAPTAPNWQIGGVR